MNPPLRRIDRVSPLAWLALLIPVLHAVAQPSAELEIQTYAGLTITGEVGKVYSVEYVTDPSHTNDASAWRCLEFLQLPASPYLWVDKSALATTNRFYRALVMEAPTNMVFIPRGTFRMGSSTNEVDRYENEGPQTDVIISRGFWMGKYEVTQGEYEEVMGNNPSWFNGIRQVWDEELQMEIELDSTDPNRPVESVTWNDAVAYCAALTQREQTVRKISAGNAYRLPTEAEWEYACRAWTSTRFSYGDDPGYAGLTKYAWYQENSGVTWLETHPVGQRLPNLWGLYDMYGNVLEWCQDRWSRRLPGGIAPDPQGPEWSQDQFDSRARVIRGGYWGDGAWRCRSAFRGRGGTSLRGQPDYRSNGLGFRVVLAPGQ